MQNILTILMIEYNIIRIQKDFNIFFIHQYSMVLFKGLV